MGAATNGRGCRARVDESIAHVPLVAKAEGYFSGGRPMLLPARVIAIDWTAQTEASPIRRRAISPKARTAPSEVVDPGGIFVDGPGVARCRTRRAGDLRDARGDLHARGHVARPPRASCPTSPTRRDRDRDDAGRRFRRHVRLGIRRRGSLRADAPLRHARRSARTSSNGPTPRDRRDPRRRLQPPRSRRLLPLRVLPRLLQRPLRERMGRRDELRWRGSGPVREFFIANARYWIDEFHFDGLRLDATQQIFDSSPRTSSPRSRARCGSGGRALHLIVAENEPQDVRVVRRREQGGYGIDALWNDDFHHSAMVALTGRNEAYYTDYLGSAAGVHFGAEVGLSLPGPALQMAEEAAGHASLGLAPSSVRQLSPEPRPGREFGLGRAPARAHGPGGFAR